MQKGEFLVIPPKPKKQKDAVPRRSRTITFVDNVLPDLHEAFDKESKKESILEEIKRNALGEGSGAAPESPDHNDSSNSSNDDKIESERDTYHDENDNDFEHGDENDKSYNVKKVLSLRTMSLTKILMMLMISDKIWCLESGNSGGSVMIHGGEWWWHERTVLDVMKKNLINLLKSSSTPTDTLSEYELKHKLYDMMHKSQSFLAHDKHLDLYNTLMNSMAVDESAAKGNLDRTPSQHKRSHDGQDPLKYCEGEKSIKSRRKFVGGYSSKKSKAHDESSHYERVQSWFNELVDVKEEPEENELINGSVVLFDKIDWSNVKGNKFHHDLSKPLSLVGPPSRKKIPVTYFFNHDLEYLKYKTKEKTYALLVIKIKDARYEDEGIEEMIPYLWILSVQKYNRDAELEIYHWDPHRRWFFKGNIRHKSSYEADFLNLNQNDIEDLLLLKIQNINGVDEFDLVNSFQLYIHRIVIKKRVEVVQLGVESY
nr:hypothetical protein [Tanacetum cinerariifolium]